ncbi:hypothetical protein BDZ45DRAFT_619535, partial [Acephala macrosclerotiorum]
MVDLGKQLVAVGIASTTIAWFFVSLRCFVRFKIVESFGLDDGLMVVSLILSTLFSAFSITCVHYGIGQHNADLTLEQISQALKYIMFTEPIYVLATLFIKLSVGILLLRIAAFSMYRYILWVSMVIMTIWSTVSIALLLAQCRPLSLSWDPTWAPSSGRGSCMDRKVFTNVGYAFSAMDIFFDWVFAIIPVPMLWGLQMSKPIKCSLCIILGLGTFASTTTLVRLQYLVAIQDVTDFLFSISRPVLWSALELNLGIVAASMATLRPLFR